VAFSPSFSVMVRIGLESAPQHTRPISARPTAGLVRIGFDSLSSSSSLEAPIGALKTQTFPGW
jgi:hypothetical protein